jgi:hypothetical protein
MDHLRHAAAHFAERRYAHAQASGPAGRGIPLVLGGPWKNRERDKVMLAWGIPWKLTQLESLPLLSLGGYRLFAVPGMPELYAFMAKVAKHPDAITYLEVLARVALHSQLTLSEALAVVLDCARLDPLQAAHPGRSSSEWASVAIQAVDTWQARHQADGVGLGDEERAYELMGELRHIVASRRIAQAELDLEKARGRLYGRDQRWTPEGTQLPTSKSA